MSTTMLNVKLDTGIKRAAQGLAKEIGIPLSTVVATHLKSFIQERRLEMRAPLSPRALVGKELLKARADFMQRKNISPVLMSGREMDAYLGI